MQVEITSKKENLLLKRREVNFEVEHGDTGSTPPRLEVRKAVAVALKTDVNLVFIKRFVTKTGTCKALGTANVYDTVEKAKSIEPEYIINRNIPPEKPKEEEKK
jgi:small subunit ribosomal protein S24e